MLLEISPLKVTHHIFFLSSFYLSILLTFFLFALNTFSRLAIFTFICSIFQGTENAIQELQRSGSDMVKTATPASPESTARAIVIASARRDDEVYYPSGFIRAMVLFRSIFPQSVDSLMRLLI